MNTYPGPLDETKLYTKKNIRLEGGYSLFWEDVGAYYYGPQLGKVQILLRLGAPFEAGIWRPYTVTDDGLWFDDIITALDRNEGLPS